MQLSKGKRVDEIQEDIDQKGQWDASASKVGKEKRQDDIIRRRKVKMVAIQNKKNKVDSRIRDARKGNPTPVKKELSKARRWQKENRSYRKKNVPK